MYPRLSEAERTAMAKRLKAARYMAELTMREAASRLGVNLTSITQWESGTLPVPKSRQRLAELYGVAETTLFAEVAAHIEAAKALLAADEAPIERSA
ncbi:MAG: helix-turn-helix transcriptional regulator [Mycobacterium sp.]|nr:helix-turn-helix transcriptional regulator [Mycobacterium sp.]